jgi:alkylation response protein AidB-like acyl-CoA dehydrogenase
LGEPQTGMAQMFQMMNEAHIGLGLLAQGVVRPPTTPPGSTPRSGSRGRFQQSFGSPGPDREHEDIPRRLLLTLKAGTESMRAFILKLFNLTDVSRFDPDEAVRREAGQTVDLLTPLVKAYCSDFPTCSAGRPSRSWAGWATAGSPQPQETGQGP